MQVSRPSAGAGIMLLAFYAAGIAAAVVMDDQSTSNYTNNYTQACTKPNTDFRNNCEVQPTCDNPNESGNATIGAECAEGCFCKEGYVINPIGNCILPERCPGVECPANQSYQDCPFCGRSCENQYINIMFKCLCEARCGCKKGYIWKNRQEKECVKPEDCSKEDTKCQDTMYYSENEVRRTCLKPKGNGIKTKGCFCKNGLLYDEDSKVCRKPEECPNAQCKRGQSYYECYQKIVRTCHDQIIAQDHDTEKIDCKTGCFCNGNTFWDEDSKRCLHREECQNSEENRNCRKNDPRTEYRMCQSSTKPTCTNPDPDFYAKDCRSGCCCKKGFVYNEEKEKCMTLKECGK